MSIAWVYLILAGLLEVCWAIGLKYTEGFTRLWPSAFTFLTMAASFYLLSRAVQILPVGTAYAVWVGIGALGAGILGIILFNEPASIPRILFMVLLLVSILGLKFTSGH